MSLTERDKQKFEENFERFLAFLVNYRQKYSLEDRIENLEALMMWSLVNDAGEQGVTPELVELMKRIGIYDLFLEFLKQ